MFPNNSMLVERLVQEQQAEIQRQVRAEREAQAFPASDAAVGLGKLIGLLVVAGWLISVLI